MDEGGRHKGDGYRQASSTAWPPGVHARAGPLGYFCVAVPGQRNLEWQADRLVSGPLRSDICGVLDVGFCFRKR